MHYLMIGELTSSRGQETSEGLSELLKVTHNNVMCHRNNAWLLRDKFM